MSGLSLRFGLNLPKGGRIKHLKKTRRFHLVENLRNGKNNHQFSYEVLEKAKETFMKKRKTEKFKYEPYLPKVFFQVDDNVFCSSIPSSETELRTIGDYFDVSVLVNLNLCPLNPTLHFNVESLPGATGFQMKYVEMESKTKPFFAVSDRSIYGHFRNFHVPLSHEQPPNDQQVLELGEIFRTCALTKKKICLVGFHGIGRCILGAALHFHFVRSFTNAEILNRVREILKVRRMDLGMDQSLYICHNKLFPMNNRYDSVRHGMHSTSNIFRRQVNFLMNNCYNGSNLSDFPVLKKSIYSTSVTKLCRDNGTKIKASTKNKNIRRKNEVHSSTRLATSPKKKKKRIYYIDFKLLGETKVSYDRLKFIFFDTPALLVRKSIKNYKNLLIEMKDFYYVLQSTGYRKDFFSYWQLLFHVTFPGQPLNYTTKKEIENLRIRMRNDLVLERKIECTEEYMKEKYDGQQLKIQKGRIVTCVTKVVTIGDHRGGSLKTCVRNMENKKPGFFVRPKMKRRMSQKLRKPPMIWRMKKKGKTNVMTYLGSEGDARKKNSPFI